MTIVRAAAPQFKGGSSESELALLRSLSQTVATCDLLLADPEIRDWERDDTRRLRKAARRFHRRYCLPLAMRIRRSGQPVPADLLAAANAELGRLGYRPVTE